NEVYLGQDGGIAIHGVGSAAQFYFAKDVSQLGVAESALLAAIIRGPSLYSPFRHPEAAQERRALVLRAMRDRGTITEAEYDAAVAAPLRLRERPEPQRSGRYFVDYVASRLRADHGDDAMSRGLTVFTTLDLRLQRAAEDAVARGLGRLERERPALERADSPLQAALVALDARTGEILAMVGGRDYGTSQFNRAVYAHRQPGSAFKPIVALSALARPGENGDGEPRFTLASLLADEPLSVETPAGVWQPVNYDRQYRGSLTLREALERSLNVPFARLGLAIGPERIVETARRLGIQSPLHAVPSLALGASEVTPLEMALAYGVLAAGGLRAPLNSTHAVVDADGAVVSRFAEDGVRMYDAAETYLVTSALRGAVERGTGRGLRTYGYRGAVAAKSGTTNDFRDGWFIGYTPTIAVAVWVGFDDGRSLGLPGSQLALPIFARFLAAAVGPDGEGEFPRPWDVEVVEVNRETGLRAGPGCRGDAEVFLSGTAPQQSCSPYWDRFSRWDEHFRLSERAAPLVRELLRRLERGGR
ncbi:MAG: transglycosylase domain-containing protein, partial [Gemmatimonadales bacterium]|nr:transglycosylase domain-containing protein [Gemmatimonadales bacterium]